MLWSVNSPVLRRVCQTPNARKTVSRSVATAITMPSQASKAAATDWNQFDDFFSFTRGRFVVDEVNQMKQRYIRFNMNELVQVAARSVGARECISVQKYPDGMYNKCFLLAMDDGQEVVAKIPNPNSGVRHYTTASEVATMDFARNTLGTPVPKVYAWKSQTRNEVGAEYIIMEKMLGVQLSQVWKGMELVEKVRLLINLASYQAAWLSVSFRQFGGLYYAEDLKSNSSGEEYLYTNQKGEKIHDSRFTIGPMTGREWCDYGRADLKCDRGPWFTLSEYRRAVGLRELAAISSIKQLPRQTVMVCGPGLYLPTLAKKSSAIQSYLQIYDALLPHDPAIMASSIWHDDLHEENIFVDRDNPTKIVGIIDWQSTDLLPLFDHNLDPAFVQYSGPKPESLEQPELGDLSEMSQEEIATATTDYFNKALFVASRKIGHKRLPAVYSGIEYQQTEAFDLLTIARRIFEFGEAHFHALSVEISDVWSELPQRKQSTISRPFPLICDESRLAEIQDDCEKSMHGMQIMNSFKNDLGPLWPDKDAVSLDSYHETKAALRELKDEVIEEFARSLEERAQFEKLWPFDE